VRPHSGSSNLRSDEDGDNIVLRNCENFLPADIASLTTARFFTKNFPHEIKSVACKMKFKK
jgi:hypothetical protein